MPVQKTPRWQTRDHEDDDDDGQPALFCRLCIRYKRKKSTSSREKLKAIFDHFCQRRQILFVCSWNSVQRGRRRKSIVLNFAVPTQGSKIGSTTIVLTARITTHVMRCDDGSHATAAQRWPHLLVADGELSPSWTAAATTNVEGPYRICCSLKSI